MKMSKEAEIKVPWIRKQVNQEATTAFSKLM